MAPLSLGHRNLSRFLRSTGEQPKSLLEIGQLLTELGLNSTPLPLMSGYGVFADGQIWGTHGRPLALIGRPYELSDEDECLFELLAEYTTLQIDFHRPSPTTVAWSQSP